METKNITTNNHQLTDEAEVDFKDLFVVYLSKWKWVLGSLLVALFLAVFYVVRTIPTYQKVSSVLIKEERNGHSLGGSVAQSLSDFGMIQSSVNISNEIATFQSPDINHEVIRRLQLNNEYRLPGLLRDEVLYGSTLPIYVNFIDVNETDVVSLNVTVKPNGQIQLSDFQIGKEEIKEDMLTMFGDSISTPIGKICISQNLFYRGEPITTSIRVSHRSSFSAIEGFRSKLCVSLRDKSSTVIDLSYTDENVERAVDALHTLVTVYKEFWMKDKNEITYKTTEFINDRLRLLENDLTLVDDDIATYKSSQRLPDVAATASIDLQMSAEIERKIQELNNQLSVSDFLLNYIKTSGDQLLPANVGLTESTILSQVSEYNQLCLQRNRLVGSSSEENLLVKDIDSQKSVLREAIINSVSNYISATRLQLKAVEANREKVNSRISSNPKQAGHLLSAERQQKVKEGLYLFLLQKKEENEISQTFVPYNTRVIMEPEYGGSNLPVAPQKKKILLGAFVLGLLLPLGVIYLLLSYNTKVRGRKDLEGMSTPFVGEIPQVESGEKRSTFSLLRKKKKEDHIDIVVKHQARDVVNEAFRVVRTNIDFMLGDKKVIMVTSANVNSGKTFVSSNLSSSFGLKNEKVVVIDLDLRKKTLSNTFGCTGDKGVVDYLSGKTDKLESLIVHKNVDVLPVGKIPPNPAELLAGKRLGALMEKLREQYDYVFVDCPPVEIVTDADIIKQWTDMTLFVIRANLLEKAILPDIERYYQEKRFNQLAIVLNGTEAIGRYGYKYGYYRNHYGYYGSYEAYYSQKGE